MPLVAGYHRPTTVDEAVSLLADPRRVVLAGGTTLNADRTHSDLEAVDLQALGLDAISVAEPGRLHVGSMVTLDALSAHPGTPPGLARLARAELPSTLRTIATVGGVVSGRDAESPLLAGLLVCGAVVTLADGSEHALPDVLASGLGAGALITAVTVETAGTIAEAHTARTPADRPIVAAVARSNGSETHVALTGVGATPVLVDAADPTAGLEPPGDFRGSPEYRRHLAETLIARAVGALA